MSEQRSSFSWKRSASIFLVMAASGLLFQVSAATTESNGEISDGNLVGLVRHHQETVAALETERQALADQVASLTDDLPTVVTPPLSSASSTIPITGPGVLISLTDAPAGDIPEGLSANDLVIHQQDIEEVMNALWNAGAEAMTVQGVRVTSRTVIRCIGNVILVDGTSFSPPYVIGAIGDPEELERKILANPRIQNYMQYVTLYGLGWDLKKMNEMEMPATTQDVTLAYAKVVD